MTIEFVFDYASPWVYLASALVPERFAGLDVTYVPTYLRAFESFKEGLPYAPAKLAYLLADFRRIAGHVGLEPKMPSAFPINGVHALRGAIAAQREGDATFHAYHRAMLAAVWEQDRDASSKEVVKVIAREAGAPGVAEALEDPSIKDVLRANGDRAIARGAFGVPTFFVGGEMFWGQDRMADAARAARGRGEMRGAPASAEEAWAFARRWASAWSRLDVEGVLAHFADDAAFVSPLAKQVTGSARVVGKEALRAYWVAAVKTITSMRFDVVDVVWSPADRLLVVVYDRTKNGVQAHCTEHMRFGERGQVVEGKAFYGA
jgi:2-hydroxychromene-2-carboxylate isomerase/ketosteroid isomerase-like protein